MREEDNPVDANAVAVCRRNGGQLGYLPAKLAADIVARLRQGFRFAAYLTEVTGGEEDKPNLGANLLILAADPGVSDEVVVEYFNEVIGRDESLLSDLRVDSLTAVPQAEEPVPIGPRFATREAQRECCGPPEPPAKYKVASRVTMRMKTRPGGPNRWTS